MGDSTVLMHDRVVPFVLRVKHSFDESRIPNVCPCAIENISEQAFSL